LFSDYIPFDLFLSPGRARSVNAVNNTGASVNIGVANRGESLFYPIELEYCFAANSSIQLDVKNASGTPLTYYIMFHGIRILASQSVSGIRTRV
jgi:hypothetical protein